MICRFAENYDALTRTAVAHGGNPQDPSGSPVPYGGKPAFRTGLTALPPLQHFVGE